MSLLKIEITKKQDKALQKMADQLGTTKAKVLQKGMVLLQVALRENKDGNKIGITRDNKIIKEIVGII